MTKSYIQPSTRFNKINHPHYFVEAVRKKDYIGICRHFLWQMNRSNNQPLTQKSIVSTIAGLTEYGDIDSRTLTNALVIMAKHGEIERFKGITNRVGWNPDVTNQVKWTRFNSSYNGNSLQIYTEEEANSIMKLLKLSNSAPFSPRDFEDLQHTIEIEENEMLKEQVVNLRSDVASLKSEVASVTENLASVTVDLEAFKKLCYEKFKTSEIQEWFKEHGLGRERPAPILDYLRSGR